MPAAMDKVSTPQKIAAREPPLSEPLLLSAVLTITALVYAAAIRFQFVYDDQGQIVDNALVQAWRFVPQYFRGQVWQHLFPNAVGDYYRPLNVLWFRINDALFGLKPAGWHAFAILLHVCATALTYFIARKLTGRPLVAALTALLFGVHPMRHEVVAWVSGTTESLFATMFLLAFLAYLKSCEQYRPRWMTLSCVFYAAALLSKETAIVLPAVVFAHAWLYGGETPDGGREKAAGTFMKAAKTAAIYAPVAIAYLIVRISVLHGFSHSHGHASVGTFVLTLPSVLFFYLRQWLLPIRLSPFYDIGFSNQWDAVHLWLPLLGVLAIFLGVWLFRDQLGKRNVAFAIAWSVLTLLPALDLFVFSSGDLVHDRYFYLPGFGAALLIALAAGSLAGGPLTFGIPRRLLLATLLVLAPLSYSAANAASYWVNDFILFEHAHAIAPKNATVRNNYAIELDRRGNRIAATPLLTQLLVENPNNWLANYNLGRLSYEQADWAKAEQYFRKAQSIDPNQADAYLQLGLIALRRNQVDQAESDIRTAIALRPVEPTFYFALGVTLAQRGDCKSARSAFAETLALKPTFANAAEQMLKCRVEAAKRKLRLAFHR